MSKLFMGALVIFVVNLGLVSHGFNFAEPPPSNQVIFFGSAILEGIAGGVMIISGIAWWLSKP